MGRLVTGPDYLKAEQLRRVLIEDLAKVFADVDVIIGPDLPTHRMADRGMDG